MAVSVDAVATADVTTASAQTLSNTNLTVGSAATSLLAFVEFSGSPTSIVCTWDAAGSAPQAMTLINTGDGGAGVSSRIYGLVKPHAGNLTLTVTWTPAAKCSISAMSFNGSLSDHATGVGGCFTNFGAGDGSGSSQTFGGTTKVGNLSIASAAAATAITSLSTTGSSVLFRDNTNFGGAVSYVPITASPTNWTLTNTGSQLFAYVFGQVNQGLSPARVDLVLTPTVPTVQTTNITPSISPAAIDTLLTGTAPGIASESPVISPAKADVILSPAIPIFSSTVAAFTPNRIDLLLSKSAPTILVTEYWRIAPTAANLLVTRTGPSIIWAGHAFSPSARLTVVSATAPTVLSGQATLLIPATCDLVVLRPQPSVYTPHHVFWEISPDQIDMCLSILRRRILRLRL